MSIFGSIFKGVTGALGGLVSGGPLGAIVGGVGGLLGGGGQGVAAGSGGTGPAPPAQIYTQQQYQAILDQMAAERAAAGADAAASRQYLFNAANEPVDYNTIRAPLTDLSQSVYDQIFGQFGSVNSAIPALNAGLAGSGIAPGEQSGIGGGRYAGIIRQGQQDVSNTIGAAAPQLYDIASRNRATNLGYFADIYGTDVGRRDQLLSDQLTGMFNIENLNLGRFAAGENAFASRESVKKPSIFETVLGGAAGQFLGSMGGAAGAKIGGSIFGGTPKDTYSTYGGIPSSAVARSLGPTYVAPPTVNVNRRYF